MAEYSYFEFACLCGTQYRVRYEGTYRCQCGRILELDWSFAAREHLPARVHESDIADGRTGRDDDPPVGGVLGSQLLEEPRWPLGVESGAGVGLSREHPR